jgi:ribosomal protein L32
MAKDVQFKKQSKAKQNKKRFLAISVASFANCLF